MEGVMLKNWVKDHLADVESDLLKYGAILFRGFDVPTREEFQEVMKQFGHEFLSYKDRSSPRSEVKENIYNSTEHPSDQVINMHNELSYSHTWPQKIAFYCFIEPSEGGETPIADVRKVLGRLNEATRKPFYDKGVMYRRLLQQGIGLAWQEVYQTSDRLVVEEYCKQHQLQYTWLDGDKLEIKWHRPAIRKHPETGEEAWFNHGYFFNFAALPADIKTAFETADELPFNTYYGDGTAIEDVSLQAIRQAYDEECVYFSWKQGDILLLDNMLAAHGRNSYKGKREINVVMIQARS
jgi:Probable taurine catabolism dioxygenase